jgi:ferrous iron transport protein B
MADTSPPTHPPLVILTGNPNCGKTTLFNALTGLRAKVGNYTGVTVEKKEGRLLGVPKNEPITVLDLPGTYSLSPQSLDERIARDVLFHRLPEIAAPDLVVLVMDASSLERSLYYCGQVMELGYPLVVALNMMDVATDMGQQVDPEALAKRLGVPVVPMVASHSDGVTQLRSAILRQLKPPPRPVAEVGIWQELSPDVQREVHSLAGFLAAPNRAVSATAEALLILTDEKALADNVTLYPDTIRQRVANVRQCWETAGVDWRLLTIEARYRRASAIRDEVVRETAAVEQTWSDRLDRVVTHKFWGFIIFVAIMALMFESIFRFARLPMDLLTAGVDWLGLAVGRLLPPGDLHSLITDGVIAGAGAVVVFLPQICLLFLFIGLLEDTGYMARAAFIMDRFMSKVGLHGKSFIPMLSSFACAIPGIMATRTIESARDRLVTILIVPLLSCSARLPVYTLLIAACIPNVPVLGLFELPGLTMVAMYFLGILAALIMAWIFKSTLLKGEPPMLIMELPPYKRPSANTVFRHVWDRAMMFLRRAGTVILGINILLWFFATYPRGADLGPRYEALRQPLRQARQTVEAKSTRAGEIEAQLAALDRRENSEKLQNSFAGRAGRLIEPLIAPLGMDWKIGIGLISSFAAREVFVSTMSIVYQVDNNSDSQEHTASLAESLRAQRRPDGTPMYTPLMAVALMVFYVFALQCVSTVAVVRRETNSWKWPLFQWAYMGALAWGGAYVVWRAGHWLGY